MGETDYSDDSEEDDDIYVWKDMPDFSDYDSLDEPLAGHFRKFGTETKGKQKQETDFLKKAKSLKRAESTVKTEELEEIERPKTTPAAAVIKRTQRVESQTKTIDIPLSDIDLETGKLTEKAFREREVQYALSTARRSLTHMSQFLLKLEARAGKTTKEGIRQTLDATVLDMNYDFNTCGSDGGPPDPDHKSEIEEIKHLSNELYHRLYLIDRHWRRIARDARNSTEKCPEIGILNEPDVKEWIKVELKTNHLAAEETCFYTVRDLQENRSFWDWAIYLQELCGFGEHPNDEMKLVELAWRFLDRNLRGPRPLNPTSMEQFVGDLQDRWESGEWDEILKNPKKQESEDAAAWKLLRRYWSSRTAPS
ncbi:hypothetical protein F5Y12DRAFT_783020 [Xylaria sp. FL1777]|nr:hypothetical protein F5Y12DRAFT_783020 [Xylaria sp. FL1777]